MESNQIWIQIGMATFYGNNIETSSKPSKDACCALWSRPFGTWEFLNPFYAITNKRELFVCLFLLSFTSFCDAGLTNRRESGTIVNLISFSTVYMINWFYLWHISEKEKKHFIRLQFTFIKQINLWYNLKICQCFNCIVIIVANASLTTMFSKAISDRGTLIMQNESYE